MCWLSWPPSPRAALHRSSPAGDHGGGPILTTAQPGDSAMTTERRDVLVLLPTREQLQLVVGVSTMESGATVRVSRGGQGVLSQHSLTLTWKLYRQFQGNRKKSHTQLLTFKQT